MKRLSPRGRAALLLASALLAGCAAPKGGGAPEVIASPEAPVGVRPSGAVEVQAFKGGFDIDFYAQAAKEFNAKTPGMNVSVDGGPDVAQKLQPRLVAGSPPDLMFPGWKLDQWAAAEEGQLMRLDDALKSPAYGDGAAWGDTFEPSLLKLGRMDGHQYMLPFFYDVWGLWYNPDQFAAHGWQVPKTYDELLSLCAKIKAAGIAPLTFQGQYPYYMLQGMLLPWAQDIGGIKAIDDAQNLVPGAWKSPAILQAAQMIKDLQAKGYFEDGAVGLSHTESQTSFVTGKAAMIPCGTWLDSEMRKEMPPGTRIRFMVPPAAKGAGDPTAVAVEIEPWMIPTQAKNPNGAVAFYKYMTSRAKAQQFVQQKSGLMAIKGSDAGKLPDTLVAPAAAFRATKTAWSYQLRSWYQPMEKEIEDALTELLNGGTAQAFCDRCEKAAQAERDDASVKKFKVGE